MKGFSHSSDLHWNLLSDGSRKPVFSEIQGLIHQLRLIDLSHDQTAVHR